MKRFLSLALVLLLALGAWSAALAEELEPVTIKVMIKGDTERWTMKWAR